MWYSLRVSDKWQYYRNEEATDSIHNHYLNDILPDRQHALARPDYNIQETRKFAQHYKARLKIHSERQTPLPEVYAYRSGNRSVLDDPGIDRESGMRRSCKSDRRKWKECEIGLMWWGKASGAWLWRDEGLGALARKEGRGELCLGGWMSSISILDCAHDIHPLARIFRVCNRVTRHRHYVWHQCSKLNSILTFLAYLLTQNLCPLTGFNPGWWGASFWFSSFRSPKFFNQLMY